MSATDEVGVRHEWSYEVRTACQEFHNRTFEIDRHGFENAVDWLRRSAPAPSTIQESDWLKTILKDGVVSSGISFHRRYHTRESQPPCLGSPIEASHHVWAVHEDDPRVSLKRWVAEFLRAFDDAHPISLAERAAAILRTRFRNPPGLDELAHLLGTSRSALARAFQRELGITRGEYLARVRLQYFVKHARLAETALTLLAEESGYRSYHNLVEALRQRTGLTPRTIRGLARSQLDEVLRTDVSLSPLLTERQRI